MSAQRAENSREEQARQEIGQTEITTAQAVVLAAALLVLITVVPACQFLWGLSQWRRSGEAPCLAAYAAFDGTAGEVAHAWRRGHSLPRRSLPRRVLDGNAVLLRRIDAFQRALDETHWLTRATQPPVQALLCRAGAGNEKAFVGRDGWLFFEPGLRYLTGPPFLDPGCLRRRARGGSEYAPPPQPDPVRGILHFRAELARRDVALVVMPIPVKPSIRPDAFTRRLGRDAAPIQNPSFGGFAARLRAAGVPVVETAAALAGVEGPAYLRTDTHWRPETMRLAAAEAAGCLRGLGLAGDEAGTSARFLRGRAAVTNLGDIAVMLKLPRGQRLYPAESVTTEPVRAASGQPWRSDSSARVLLLGDSFANIYSLPEMGWGSGAGLAEQLSVELQEPVERIVRNDSGAFATREMLAMDLARGRDRLAGKSVVLWAFAARELAVGDWRLISLPAWAAAPAPAAAPQPGAGAAAGWTTVRAAVADVSERPERGAVYKDFVMKLHVTGLTDAAGHPVGDGEGIVHVFGMRDREVLPLAGVQPGTSVRLRIRPWADVGERYGALKSGALEDVMLELEKTLYWGEPVETPDAR